MKTYKERREDLRAEVIKEMEQLRKEGMTLEAIGELYGMSRSGVNNLMKGHSLAK